MVLSPWLIQSHVGLPGAHCGRSPGEALWEAAESSISDLEGPKG